MQKCTTTDIYRLNRIYIGFQGRIWADRVKSAEDVDIRECEKCWTIARSTMI